MAILQAKNELGQWTPVAEVQSTEVINQLIGEIKRVQINPIVYQNPLSSVNANAFDLSPYISSGDDFCLFFTTSSGVGGTGCIPLVYIKSDGKVRHLHDKITVQMTSLNDLFPTTSQCAVSYDEETFIFKVNMQEASDQVYNNAWLFYAGIKEA